jgi:hypothetical protein
MEAAHVTRRSGQTSLGPSLPLAFLPLHKAAFGTAVGLVLGSGIVVLTAYQRVAQPEHAPALHLLSQYFRGYGVSWRGAAVGGLWGLGVGFVAGWFAAFVRNFALAASVWLVRTKAELKQTADFLDHI